MKTLIVSSLALLVCACSSAPKEETSATFPLAFTEKGHAYVNASVGNINDYPMILDTAANIGVIPNTLLTQLDMPKDAMKKMDVQGAGGSHVLTSVKVPNTQVGQFASRDLTYVVQDLKGLEVKDGIVPGILGHGFLSQFCAIIDFKQAKLTLQKTSCTNAQTQGLKSADFRIEDHFVKIDTYFNGQHVDSVLDTGSPTNFINSTLADSLNLTLLEKDTSKGLHASKTKKQKISSLNFAIGEHIQTSTSSFVSDMPVFKALGYEGKPFILLGLSNFTNNKLVLDYTQNKLYF